MIYFLVNNYTYLKQIKPSEESIEDDSCLSGITFLILIYVMKIIH